MGFFGSNSVPKEQFNTLKEELQYLQKQITRNQENIDTVAMVAAFEEMESGSQEVFHTLDRILQDKD